MHFKSFANCSLVYMDWIPPADSQHTACRSPKATSAEGIGLRSGCTTNSQSLSSGLWVMLTSPRIASQKRDISSLVLHFPTFNKFTHIFQVAELSILIEFVYHGHSDNLFPSFSNLTLMHTCAWQSHTKMQISWRWFTVCVEKTSSVKMMLMIVSSTLKFVTWTCWRSIVPFWNDKTVKNTQSDVKGLVFSKLP